MWHIGLLYNCDFLIKCFRIFFGSYLTQAGKTTLVKMLTGIIAPSSGSVRVLGYYPNKLEKQFRQQYALVMGQKSQLFFELTTGDTLQRPCL